MAMNIRKLVLSVALSCISGSALAQQGPTTTALAAPAAAPTGASTGAPAIAAAPATTATVPISDRPARNTASMPADYAISSQDTLTIDVFGVPELNQAAIQVDNAGTIAMPLIGRV